MRRRPVLSSNPGGVPQGRKQNCQPLRRSRRLYSYARFLILGFIAKCRSPHMYQPNFCSECGAKILRLRWHVWTSRKFCSKCAGRFRKTRFGSALLTMLGMFGAGYVVGLVRRADPPPLIIERRSDSPLSDTATVRSTLRPATPGAATNSNSAINSPASLEEVVYLCGARTKKGTPCSRRVHGPVRCWQHKGMPAMLPQEKLLVK